MACVREEGGLPRTPKNAPSYPHPGSVCMSPCDTILAHHVARTRCRQRARARAPRGKQGG